MYKLCTKKEKSMRLVPGQQTVVSESYGYFKVYRYLPAISAICIYLAFFILGIVDPIVFDFGDKYGIMLLPSGFLCWLIWVLIGGLVGTGSFFLLKVVLSGHILQVEYLRIIALNATKVQNSTTSTTVKSQAGEVPDLQAKWVCKACGQENNHNAYACIGCGKSKFFNK